MAVHVQLQHIRMPEFQFIESWRTEIAEGLEHGALSQCYDLLQCYEKRVTLPMAQMSPEDYVEYRKLHGGKPSFGR